MIRVLSNRYLSSVRVNPASQVVCHRFNFRMSLRSHHRKPRRKDNILLRPPRLRRPRTVQTVQNCRATTASTRVHSSGAANRRWTKALEETTTPKAARRLRPQMMVKVHHRRQAVKLWPRLRRPKTMEMDRRVIKKNTSDRAAVGLKGQLMKREAPLNRMNSTQRVHLPEMRQPRKNERKSIHFDRIL